jgi:hypothetical protein
MINHPNRSKNSQAPEGAPAIGSFVSVPFGSRAEQIAQVVGYGTSKYGPQIKVRAWNATQGHWMPNARPITFGDWIKPATAAHLPAPPAI